MQLVRTYTDVPETARGAVVALGNFDGVHLGHQAVIGEARRLAGQLGASSGVMTFAPHPRRFFKPDDPRFELTPAHAKRRSVEGLGIDVFYLMEFNAEFAAISAEDFVQLVLVDGLGARHLVVGYDFVFGRGRAGNVEQLQGLGERFGFGVTVIDPVAGPDGAAYSSTVIREHLRAGRVRDAAALLGHAWEIEGEVMTGDQRGRQIGFPTANIDPGDHMMPLLGVYAVWAGITSGDATDWHPAVANIGRRPTFQGDGIKVEAHLFDFDGDLYGKVLRVALIEFLRPEITFDGIEAIRAQIGKDSARARATLDALPPDDLCAPPGGARETAL
jgi:riboflavin kinase/FMN adenylyltransferase